MRQRRVALASSMGRIESHKDNACICSEEKEKRVLMSENLSLGSHAREIMAIS